MGWELRNGKYYYYTKQRIGSRVVSEYVGAGALAQYQAMHDDMERAQAAQRLAAWKATQASDRAFNTELDTFLSEVRRLKKCVLLLAGCKTHKGEWRMAKRAIDVSPNILSKEEATELLRRDFAALVERVNSEKPSHADLKALAECYQAVPAVYKEVVGMGAAVKKCMIDKSVSGLASQMALRCELDDMRTELGFDSASGLERLLIDAVVLSWLRLQHVEYWRTEVDSWQAREYWDKQLSAAQRRFLRACESLAKVRKLLSRPATVARSIKVLDAMQV